MRILAVLAVLATLAWGGYWVVGSRALDRAITAGLAATPEITVADHRILGFPNRFDVTLDAPRVSANGVEWTTPFLQIFALSYRLNHVIAVFAPDQRLVASGIDALLHNDDLRASLVMEPGLDLPLDRFSLVGQGLELSLAGNTHRAEGLRAASRRIAEREHDVVLLLETVFPDTGLMDRADPEHIWPRRFDVLRLNAEVELDRAIDRHAIGGPEPRVQRLTLTGARMAWPGTDLTATGRLTPGADGLLSGDMAVSVTGWRALMQSARVAGLMPAEHDALITLATQGLVSADDPNRIDAAFSVVNGVVWLGPVQVGQIPALF
jgi:hypothetical protein